MASVPVSLGGRVVAVARVVSGNVLEMYDFMVYGFYASEIASAFFPAKSAFASLMQSFGVFGAGFLMRPLGAVVLGAYIDRHGRRPGLLLTLALMALGTLMIAAMPGYVRIGLLAPLLVLLGRLLQGFSAGVELGVVSVYLAEIATPGHSGFYVSWQSASQQVAVMAASLSGFALHSWLAAEDRHSWGWRIPFLFGCAIVPVLFYLRSSLKETTAFRQRVTRPTVSQITTSLLSHWRLIIQVCRSYFHWVTIVRGRWVVDCARVSH